MPLNRCVTAAHQHNNKRVGCNVSKAFTDIDGKALEALIARVSEAKENNLALSADDCQLLLDALVTLASMQDRLANHDVTVHKLRKLLGIERSSERRDDVRKQPKAAPKKRKKKPKDGEEGFTPVKPKVTVHPLTDMSKGDNCPKCFTGKVYKTEPGSFLRITGQSPFTPEQHGWKVFVAILVVLILPPLCQMVFYKTAPAHKNMVTPHALMAIYKYFAGLPFYRQGSIQQLLGVKMTASTVFDQVELVCNAIYPVYQHLFNLAADAEHYYLDDTTHRILDAKPIEKKVRNSNKTQLRSGVYTSGVIATTRDNRHIVLFETNIGHAGEFIDSILHKRARSSRAPIIMSDALPSNQPSVLKAVISLCNCHARRQFVDVINHFPDEVEHILKRYGEIWTNEHQVIEQELTPVMRLAYHKQHSLPVMAEIKRWGETHLSEGSVEENSGLGKAIRYFIKHYDGLSCFCTHEGVKLDNNQIEAMLKIIVRDRKNAMFHKTLLGATIGDVITSMIASASEAGINVFDYFTVLQQNQEKVKATPENFLPWNYLKNS
jgi:transposase